MLVDVVFGLPSKNLRRLVVVDVFRSSTSIVIALENGAEEIIPCASIEEARRLKKLDPDVLLVGEERGITPEGFDLNISPSLLTRDRV
ncbi:MAG: 2-phosphosulfolactate phosphatase, partial [Thaumarchaeota archaeon]|nr:2-phosphosulfolactate phosphatase [Nitrososphaerota archaeon]